MNRKVVYLIAIFAALLLGHAGALAGRDADHDNSRYCMDVDIQPFHMMPEATEEEPNACAVRDFWDGELQDTFYPFTKEDHELNCAVFGSTVQLTPDIAVPSSVVSQGEIVGTIGPYEFSATLYCASLTNWYADYCPDPSATDGSCFQLAQPFMKMGLPFPRVTEVSVFDGQVKVGTRGKKVPLLMATRAAGITHLEDLSSNPPQVGASITHSALGMLTYDDDGHEARVLDGSLDLLLQGHIFSPKAVEDDPGAAVIRGTICSKDLYKLLKKATRRGGKGRGRE